MQLACNYSPQLIALLDARTARVDYIKCSRFDLADTEVRHAADYAPVLTHFLPAAGAPPAEIDDFPWDWLNGLNRDVRAPWVATHLEAPVDPDAVDETPSAGAVERIHACLLENIGVMERRLTVPLHLELIPYSRRRPVAACCVEPDFVTSVVRASDCPLLLDTAHAQVTAQTLGIPLYDYLQALPLDHLVEVHCSGVIEEDGQLRDRHLELAEGDYLLLEWVRRHSAAQVITLEYGGTGPLFVWRSDAEALDSQLRRLRSLCETGFASG